MKISGWVKLFLFILICQLAGGVGSLFTRGALQDWYPSLVKPSFNPPAWIFAPVWTFLYALMGVAAFQVHQKGFSSPAVKTALLIFAIQLLLNSLWSVIFFGLRAPLGALVELGFLWIFVSLTIYAFFRISSLAGWLLVPYLFWISFAFVLNYALVVLNPR